MTKPHGSSTSGAHFNHSLQNIERGVNAFFDKTDVHKMSEIAKHWVAGLQYHAKGLMALSCPTINCYRRVVPNICCPINNTWGFEARTAAFRFKSYDEEATYLEHRIPSSACNPYLVTSAVIVSGMDGIENKMKISEEMKGMDHDHCPIGTQMLPTTLKEALECLKNDEVLAKALGEDFLKQFCLIKELELEGALQASTDDRLHEWEKKVYWTYV